jgi:phenylacetate-CoA ligase
MNKYIKESIKYALRSNVTIMPFVRQIEKLYTLTEDELRIRNEKVFLNIFRRAIVKSKFYRKLYHEHGITIDTVKSLDDISRLPIIDKQMINKNPGLLLTVPRVFLSKSYTSGTTGMPLTVYNDYFSVLREQAYQYVFRKRREFKYGNRLVSLRGNLDRNLLKLKVNISNTLYLSSYKINEQTTEKYYGKIHSFEPVAIEGYPSSLYNLCCFLKERDLKLSIPVCFTSSETLFDFQRKLIEDVLNTEIFDYYGNTERTISLAECIDHRGYFSQPGYSISEFRNDNIITTSLINSSFPLIRYKVDDIVSLSGTPALINSELCIIDSIYGKAADNILTKDGTKIGRLFFTDVENMKLAQVIQHERGVITVNIVPDGIFSEKDKIKLLKNIDERIGLNNIDVNISIVDYSQIIYTKRNKFRQVISTVK